MRLPSLSSLTPADRRRWIALGVFIAIVEVVYVFIVSAGKFVDWPRYLSYYDSLAEGFRSGHLHLSITPRPELVAAANPRDEINQHLWAGDASLYKGQYYIYWGPVPALLLAAIKIVFRVRSGTSIGDQYLVFVFYSVLLVLAALLLERMWRRLWSGVPAWALGLGLAAFAFAIPTPHSLANASVYSAAIAGGQTFLLAGLLIGFVTVDSQGDSVPVGRLLAIGGCWALAIGCRATLSFNVALLCLVTALATSARAAPRARRLVRDLFWLGLVPALGMCALLLYNKLRFESWMEFGFKWQLTTIPFVMGRAYLAPNLYSYLLRPMTIDCHFPFIEAPWNLGTRGFPAGTTLPAGYYAAEPMVGILPGLGLAWFGIAAVAGAIVVLRGRRAANAGEPTDTQTRTFLWCVGVFVVMCTNSAFALLFLFMPSMRYLGDVNVGLVFLGILGVWWLLVRYRNSAWRRRLVTGLAIALGAATILVGLLLGYQGYGGHFRTYNPSLHERLTRSLSVCRS